MTTTENGLRGQAPTESVESVLGFWFPRGLSGQRADTVRQVQWWFRGGADAALKRRFEPLLEQAARGELDDWADSPRSRLALIIVLDQFSRSIHRGSARAFAQDPKALRLALDGIEAGHYAALGTPWQKTFFFMPLGHAEDLAHLDLAVRLADDLARQAPAPFRWWFEFSAQQARGHRDVVSRFGRQPHRNQVLGRRSTPDEAHYLDRGEFVHTRALPAAAEASVA